MNATSSSSGQVRELHHGFPPGPGLVVLDKLAALAGIGTPGDAALLARGLRVSTVAEYHASGAQAGAAQPAEVEPPVEQRSPPSEKILRLVDEITSLTLLEVTDMNKLLKQRLGIKDGPMGMPMMMNVGAAPAAAGAAAPKEEEKAPEKTAFDVKLEKYEASAKIKIIKEVRTFTALGLKEAKELVEKTPCILKKGVSKEEAEQIIEKVKAVGGTAVME